MVRQAPGVARSPLAPWPGQDTRVVLVAYPLVVGRLSCSCHYKVLCATVADGLCLFFALALKKTSRKTTFSNHYPTMNLDLLVQN